MTHLSPFPCRENPTVSFSLLPFFYAAPLPVPVYVSVLQRPSALLSGIQAAIVNETRVCL